MSTEGAYLVDSDVFIAANRQYYAFPICPGFWDGLMRHHELENVYSIDQVKEELLRGKDKLTDWVKQKPLSEFFLSTKDTVVAKNYGEVMNWVYGNPQFQDAAKEEFAKGADGWLVAYTKTYGGTVVTGEQLNLQVKARVPIPNVCEKFDVPYKDTFQMLAGLQVKLILE